MGLLTCFHIKNLNLCVCLRIFFFFFEILDSILNLTKGQFHGLSLVPIQKKKKNYIFWICGVLINKVSQGSQKNKKYLQFIMGVLAQAQNGDKQFWK
jgi:hypothetical protein